MFNHARRLACAQKSALHGHIKYKKKTFCNSQQQQINFKLLSWLMVVCCRRSSSSSREVFIEKNNKLSYTISLFSDDVKLQTFYDPVCTHECLYTKYFYTHTWKMLKIKFKSFNEISI